MAISIIRACVLDQATLAVCEQPMGDIVASLLRGVMRAKYLPTFPLPCQRKMGIVGAGKGVWILCTL
jgi:hypothetical protein